MSPSIVHAETDAAHLLECKEGISDGEFRLLAEISSDAMLIIRDGIHIYANLLPLGCSVP